MVAGKSGLTLLGHSYNKITPNFLELSNDQYLSIVEFFLLSLQSNWLSVISIYCFPLLVLIAYIFNNRKHKFKNEFRFYFIILFFLVAITSLFTSVALFNNDDIYGSIARIYFRYYSFALPLLILPIFLLKNYKSNFFSFRYRIILGLVFACLLGYSYYLHFSYAAPELVDSPDLIGLNKFHTIYLIFTLGQLIGIFLWTYKESLGKMLYGFVLFPFYLISTNVLIDQSMSLRNAPNAYDKTFFYIQHNLTKEEALEIQFVASNPGSIIRSTIYNNYIQYPDMKWTIREQGSFIAYNELDQSKKLIILIGSYKYNEGDYSLITYADGFTILKVKN